VVFGLKFINMLDWVKLRVVEKLEIKNVGTLSDMDNIVG